MHRLRLMQQVLQDPAGMSRLFLGWVCVFKGNLILLQAVTC